MNGLPSTMAYPASNAAIGNAQEMLRGQDFQDRSREARRVQEVYEGCFGHQVEASLRSRYHTETFNQLKIQHGIQTHNRLINDILGKVCVAFAGGCKYSLKRESQVLADDAFAAFLNVADYDNLLKMLDQMTECHRGVWVMPAVHDDGASGMRRFHHLVLTPDWFNLIPAPDDPTAYVQLDVYSEEWSADGRNCEKYKHSWSADEVVKYKMWQGGWMMVQAKPNPYGIIPGVLFRRNRPLTTLWADVPGPMLAQKTVEANCWETMVSYQGSGQVKFLAGEFKNWPQGQVLRHAGVVDVGDAENINVLDLQTDVDGFIAAFISRLRSDAAVAMGLGADEFSASGTPPSGESLKMRYWARDRYAMNKRSFMVEDLKKLYADTLVVLDVNMRMVRDDDAAEEGEPATLGPIMGIDALPPEDAELMVDPNEVTYPELATERMARDDWRLGKNLTNLALLAQEENPDLGDVDAAKAFLQENQKVNAELSGAPKPVAAAAPAKMPLAARVAQMRGGQPAQPALPPAPPPPDKAGA